MNEPNIPVAHRVNPYFGLEYYDEQFGAWFFGREAEGGKIITNLRAARLTLLHADSGVGKSSLLRAGVAWRMRRLADDMFARRRIVRSIPVVFSSWKDDPTAALANSIGQAIQPYLPEDPGPALPADGLDAAVEAASRAVNANLLIMLDQFEEYFLYCAREPVPERFADELARCINRTDLRANFLIAIREDAYAGLGDLFKGRIANVYGNYLHIDYLDRASAERAIRQPLDVYNSQPDVSQPVKLQDELVQAVLSEVRAFGNDEDAPSDRAAANGGGSDRIATPLLQLVMEKVWDTEREEGSHELRRSTLQKLHGVGMIVDAHLEKALDSLSSAERQTAIDVFDHLVTPSGGKIAESVYDLAKRTGHSEAQVDGVLQKLDGERIVRPVPAPPGQDPMRFRRYEIFHDVLAPAINRKIAARDREVAALEAKRRSRRFKVFAGVGVFLLLMVTAAAIVFAALLSKVDNEKLTAESGQLAAEAYSNVAHDPELSASQAMQAMQKQNTIQAQNALRAVLPELQGMRTFQDRGTVFAAAFDPADPNKVASADFSGTAWIWDVQTKQHLVRMSLGGLNVTGSADAVAFNSSGSEVAVGYGNGTVAVFDASNGTTMESTSDGSGGVNAIEFLGSTGELAIASQQNLALWQTRDGTKCCTTLSSSPSYTIGVNPVNPLQFAVTTFSGGKNNVVIWTTSASGKPQQRQLGSQVSVSVNDAQFNPAGNELVTADGNGVVTIYGLGTVKALATFYAGDADAATASFSPDGALIIAGYSSGTARVWDVSTKLQLTPLIGDVSYIDTAQFNSSGSEVVTASEDGTIRVWYARPRELQAEIPTPTSGGTPNPVDGAEYIAGRIITLDDQGNVDVFTAAGQQQAVISPGIPVYTVDWDRAGTKIVTSDGYLVDLWRADGSGYTLAQPVFLTEAAGDVAMSPDGSRFALAMSGKFTVQVRNANSGQLQQTLSSDNLIQVVAINPDDHQIVGGDYNGRVEVWNRGATTPQVLGQRGSLIEDVGYNHSGSEFVTVAEDGTVTVWDSNDGTRLNSIMACPSPSTAAFSPVDDSKIVVACGDGTVRVFNALTGQALMTIQITSAGIVTNAAFSPQGHSIVTSVNAGNTGAVQVWNAEFATDSVPELEHLAEQRIAQ
jgi:WD40 repeat protein